MHKSCQFQIKNGRVIPPISNVEKLITYNQQYNILENSSQLIVETDILIKPTNEQPKTVKHQTLIILSRFNHQPFEIEEAVIALLFNLRHNIFDKIKLELGLTDNKGLHEHFPDEHNENQFSCLLNKNLNFENYNFSPTFSPSLLTEIWY